MKNPFEEKRKNDRINSLVKERDELKLKLDQATKELETFRTKESVWEGVNKVYNKIRDDNLSLKSQLKEAYGIIDILQSYGAINTIQGVIYEGTTHKEILEKARKWLSNKPHYYETFGD